MVEALASDVRHPLDATLIDPQQFSTLDAATLTELTGRHRIIVTLEDGQLEGGWGDKVTAFYANAGLRDMRVLNFGAAKEFTDRVPLDALNERYGMTVGNITARIRSESRAESRTYQAPSGPQGRRKGTESPLEPYWFQRASP